MICAALEAVQQLVDESKTIHSYELRDIALNRALVIPTEGDEIKMMLHMKPHKHGTKATEMPWFDFTVYSQTTDDEHTAHCSGCVRTRYLSGNDEDEETVEDSAEWDILKEEYTAYQRACKKDIKPREFYEKWNSYGMQFGKLYKY